VDSLLTQIDGVHRDVSAKLDASQSELRALTAQWQSLSNLDRGIEQRYRKAHEAATQRLQDAVRAQRLSRFTQAMDRYALLRELECDVAAPTEGAAKWGAMPPAADALTGALHTRFARTQNPEFVSIDEAAVRQRLVELEFLAGIDTPEEDRALRMTYQLQRLASRMRERSSATPETELTQLLIAWFAQAPQTEGLEKRFSRAAFAAINSLP